MNTKIYTFFITLFLVFVLLPTDILAAKQKKKSQKNIKKSVPTAKVRYRAKQMRLRRVFVPVHGVLVQTLTGDTLLAQNAQTYFNPASVMKIATSITALETLGYNYKFNTEIYTNGDIDKDNTLNGDLIIVGSGDPSLFYENAFLIGENLSYLGIKKVTGNLLITNPFYLNFDTSVQRSAQELKLIFSPTNWTKSVQEAWTEYTENRPNAVFQGLEIIGSTQIISAGEIPIRKQLLLTHQSRNLLDILKMQNDYSNNFMAEVVGEKIGGPKVIEKFLIEKVKISPSQLEVASASGLGENKMTPIATLELLRYFYSSINKNGKNFDQLLPAAGVDAGTLDERFTSAELQGSVIAKTGTLIRQKASALVGIAYTKEKGPLFFAILNKDNVLHARRYQDEIITNLIYENGGPVAVRTTSSRFESSPNILINFNNK
ncbi:MAG: D-alanyl-D-alanine carboxypeptidase [Acidobacteria bacterium]|nr:D-alanyl-D-alanine carboxypeptidase [Acidobacteriota bacterium]